MSEELYAVGKIVRARGLQGEVAVEPLTGFVDRFYDLDKVFLEGETANLFVVKSVRIHKNNILLRFEGVDSRDAAEELVGRFVSVTKAELIDLPEETFFQFDIIGMTVVSENGRLLGKIVEIIPMPANDLWRVEGETEFLLPATKNVVIKVDTDARQVVIRLLEGLIESQ